MVNRVEYFWYAVPLLSDRVLPNGGLDNPPIKRVKNSLEILAIPISGLRHRIVVAVENVNQGGFGERGDIAALGFVRQENILIQENSSIEDQVNEEYQSAGQHRDPVKPAGKIDVRYLICILQKGIQVPYKRPNAAIRRFQGGGRYHTEFLHMEGILNRLRGPAWPCRSTSELRVAIGLIDNIAEIYKLRSTVATGSLPAWINPLYVTSLKHIGGMKAG